MRHRFLVYVQVLRTYYEVPEESIIIITGIAKFEEFYGGYILRKKNYLLDNI